MTSEERAHFSPLRLMLVDDHEVVRNGLRMMLEATGDVRVVAEAGTVREAIAQAERTRPDAIVMDVRLADGSGIEATREIRAAAEDVRVLMLTGSNSRADVDRSREAGASGYVTKDRIASELVAAIVEVSRRRVP